MGARSGLTESRPRVVDGLWTTPCRSARLLQNSWITPYRSGAAVGYRKSCPKGPQTESGVADANQRRRLRTGGSFGRFCVSAILQRVVRPSVALLPGRVDAMVTVPDAALRTAQAELTDQLGVTVLLVVTGSNT